MEPDKEEAEKKRLEALVEELPALITYAEEKRFDAAKAYLIKQLKEETTRYYNIMAYARTRIPVVTPPTPRESLAYRIEHNIPRQNIFLRLVESFLLWLLLRIAEAQMPRPTESLPNENT